MKQEEHRSDDDNHLHSVQKSSKIMKKPVALTGSQQPKVYKVKPIHFRELVQQLTGAAQPHQQPLQPPPQPPPPRPQARSRRSNLQIVAPPLHPHQLQLQLQNQTQTSSSSVQCKVEDDDQQKASLFSDKLRNDNGVGTTELILSPNFQAWFSFAMMSPGSATIPRLDQTSLT